MGRKFSAVLLVLALGISGAVSAAPDIREYPVPSGSHPHDVAPATDGGVWYTAQNSGELGHLDPKSGRTSHIGLGSGSAPHGVIVGPDGAPWITTPGSTSSCASTPKSEKSTVYPLPSRGARVRQILGRPGEVWLPESGTNKLAVIRE